ncbi:hypothetical protein HBI59_173460 [Parastagonospora nodorum]|nr:hypothetical protein HBI59_173460 [Parastagonospora nodorum]
MPPQKILDSHIHLWPSTSTTSSAHAWMKPGHFLAKRHGITDYLAVADDSVKGFVYVETDRYLPSSTPDFDTAGSDVKEKLSQWAHEPLSEVKFLKRIAEGKTEDGDGGDGAGRMKGCVLWAPFHLPAPVFSAYMHVLEGIAGPALLDGKIVGFRYLLQGKEAGEVGKIVGSEAWLANILSLDKGRGGKGWTFDVGVDINRDGEEGLVAVGEMIKEVRRRGGGVRFVLNHLCKPPLSKSTPSKTWVDVLKAFKLDQNVYMKLSGALNEFDATPNTTGEIVKALEPYLDVVFECFPGRVMFGSDWPVCNVGGPKGEKGNWGFWRDVVEKVMNERGTSEEDREGIWWRNGSRAYGVEI